MLQPEPSDETAGLPIAPLPAVPALHEVFHRPPFLSAMVHFVYGDRQAPALITDPAVLRDEVLVQALTVFPAGSPPFTTVAVFDETATEQATWHWPEL